MADYFADTYALVAYYNGSEAYRPFLDERDVLTTRLNVLEFAYALLRADIASERDVAAYIAPLEPLVTDPPAAVVPDAAAFKASMLKRGLDCSFADAWGYATARHLRIPFLTGDASFERVPHVEFVKEETPDA